MSRGMAPNLESSLSPGESKKMHPGLTCVTRENSEAKCGADPTRALPGQVRPKTPHFSHLTAGTQIMLVLGPHTQKEPWLVP